LVDDAHPPFGDRTHRELRLERDTELADDDHVQRGRQCLGYLEGDRDAASWQPDNDYVVPLSDATGHVVVGCTGIRPVGTQQGRDLAA
jgi:hypothetical protein